MNRSSGKYNLLDERWIPALFNDGELRWVGITEVFAEADKIREIASSSPLDRLAVLRFLLAVLYWCRGNPPGDSRTELGDPFPRKWFTNLEDNRPLFNLLGDNPRFFQYRGSGARPLSANYLVHEIPTGTNHWHFRHARDEIDGLCPACCAMGLLRLPLFTTQGGAGKAPGINGKPPIYVLPIGSSLAETLRFSWQKVSYLGIPVWENPTLELPKTGEVPFLTGLTWFPRWVWLENPKEPEAACISCGRPAALIRHSIFAGKGSSRPKEGQAGFNWRDPHTIYIESPQYGIAPLRSRNPITALGEASREWARVLGMIPKRLHASAAETRVHIWVVSFSTDANKYFEAVEYRLPFYSTKSGLVERGKQLEHWARWRPKATTSALKGAVLSIIPHVEGTVSAGADELITDDDDAWPRAADKYRPLMTAIARSLSPGVTTAALRRREKLAAIAPEVVTVKKADRNSTKKEERDE
jgi:hypothetical protein